MTINLKVTLEVDKGSCSDKEAGDTALEAVAGFLEDWLKQCIEEPNAEDLQLNGYHVQAPECLWPHNR